MDPYARKDGTLKNLLNLNQEDLAEFEANVTASLELELIERPIIGSFDFKHLQRIHKFLFQDVYGWAGETRTTPLAKQAYDGDFKGITRFSDPLRIHEEATDLLKLPNLNTLASFDAKSFAELMATYLVRLNNIHPFREGNGRTQRAFFKTLATHCGHDFAWDVVSRERNVAVSVEGARNNLEPMKRLLVEISDPDRVRALRKAIGFLKTSGTVPWNNLYIATTQKGQTYKGKLVGAAEPDFMMRVRASIVGNKKDDWIAIGQKSDLPDGVSSGDEINIKPKFW
jgi:cell filamentation protein